MLWRGPKESPGTNHWYGRAELKQSDHRPVLSIIDIEVSKILTDVRERVFEEALDSVGPPDGSILLQVTIDSSFLNNFYKCWSRSPHRVKQGR